MELLQAGHEKLEEIFFISGGEDAARSQTKPTESAGSGCAGLPACGPAGLRAYGPTGPSEATNACRVNCVSVQIPSYSHFLFK